MQPGVRYFSYRLPTTSRIRFAVISPTLMVLAFLPIPIIVLGSLRYQKRLEPRYDAVRAAATDIGDTLSNSLGGVATVKAFNGEEREVARLEVESQRYRDVNGDAIRLSSAFIPLIRVASGLTSMITA